MMWNILSNVLFFEASKVRGNFEASTANFEASTQFRGNFETNRTSPRQVCGHLAQWYITAKHPASFSHLLQFVFSFLQWIHIYKHNQSARPLNQT